MYLSVLLIFLLAVLAPFIQRLFPRAAHYLLAAIPLGVFIYLLSLSAGLDESGSVRESYVWVESLAINLSFWGDGLGLLFALLITGIGVLIVLYSGEYLKADPMLPRFYLYLMLFMGAMLGLVLSDNIITVFIFWELTSISSYFLIGHYFEEKQSRANALQALLVTGLGGLALLAGMVLLANISGSYELSEILSSPAAMRQHELMQPVMLLLILAAFTKSAQFPFYFWLPNAMSAPTPVSAYLHSATMVKAGIYLLARIAPLFEGNEWWQNLLLIFGGITMILGAAVAVFNTDLKKILAYSTVSALGILTFTIGIGSPEAINAAVVFLVVHSLYKGALFLVAGALDHETGTRDIRKLNGLFKMMPLMGIAGIAAAFSSAGIPPFFGFIGKELIYESELHAVAYSEILIVAMLFTMVLLFVAGFNAGLKPFRGSNTAGFKAHDPGFNMLAGPVILAALGLIFGLFPGLISPLLSNTVGSVVPGAEKLQLGLWHGFNLPLLLSGITIIAGSSLYILGLYRYKDKEIIRGISRADANNFYDLFIRDLLRFASLLTRILQNGYMRYYLMAIIFTVVGLIGFTITTLGGFELNFNLKNKIYPHDVMLVLVVFVAILDVITTSSRLAAVAALGIIGLGVAIIFMFFGAPDLAMTQFTIDTLTVILFVFILYKLPRFFNRSTVFDHIRDGILAVSFGAIMGAIVLFVLNEEKDLRLMNYFAEQSYVSAHGRNIVNVILVDFRGLDTLVEITVLAVASIGVYALIKFKTGNP
jgi:multicomponent Na+:H+ antiporter subunit A